MKDNKLIIKINKPVREVFEEYKLGGAEKREDYIITKEYRDANPCLYDQGGPYFTHTPGADDIIYFTPLR